LTNPFTASELQSWPGLFASSMKVQSSMSPSVPMIRSRVFENVLGRIYGDILSHEFAQPAPSASSGQALSLPNGNLHKFFSHQWRISLIIDY
jgi:hypothetical protein